MKRSRLAEALAFELGNHVDRLIDNEDEDHDTDPRWLRHEDGEEVGYLSNTIATGYNTSFLVQMIDGTEIRVTCEEVQEKQETPMTMREQRKYLMTRREREDFEQRSDFPGWENL